MPDPAGVCVIMSPLLEHLNVFLQRGDGSSWNSLRFKTTTNTEEIFFFAGRQQVSSSSRCILYTYWVCFVMLAECFTAWWLLRFGRNKLKAWICESSLGIGFPRSWHFRRIMKPSRLICTSLFSNLPLRFKGSVSCAATQCTPGLHCSLEETLSELLLLLQQCAALLLSYLLLRNASWFFLVQSRQGCTLYSNCCLCIQFKQLVYSKAAEAAAWRMKDLEAPHCC